MFITLGETRGCIKLFIKVNDCNFWIWNPDTHSLVAENITVIGDGNVRLNSKVNEMLINKVNEMLIKKITLFLKGILFAKLNVFFGGVEKILFIRV